jgi:poly-gamma-glutamate synthesis protein (capsule biosynthesis protein)
MTGRGIDQVLSHPGDPTLHESYVKDARDYVHLAERANGPIPRSVKPSYIWGDALDELEKASPDLRIINLETSITSSDDYWRGKAINYRMHPANISCITALKPDLCVLANNHVLDWGRPGLIETLAILKQANVKSAGAGRNRKEAEAPAIMEIRGKGRVIVFAFGSPTSGIPFEWAASKNKPGINFLEDFSDDAVRNIKGMVEEVKQQGDIAIASFHWGGNWGYAVPHEQMELARRLIDHASIDVIYGHSPHHVKGIEVYKGKPVLYGCGDFLDDYEGISGYEQFRSDLGLMYFVTMDLLSGNLVRLRMTPTQIRNFRINRASTSDALWLRDILNREGSALGTHVDLDRENVLTLQWD